MLNAFEEAIELCGYVPLCVAISETRLVYRLVVPDEFWGHDSELGEFELDRNATTADEFVLRTPTDETGDITEIMSEFENQCRKRGL